MGLDDLSAAHLDLIRGSAITDEIATERGYRTITVKAQLRRCGYASVQARVPALLIPIRDVTGNVATYSLRPDDPRTVRGKALKYESPLGSRMVLDVPERVRPVLPDPGVPLFITEGSRKVDAALSVGLACIGVIGVWNWRGTNEHGGKTALPDWEAIALNGREVFVVYDSDVMVKREVYTALERLKAFLEQRDARVKVVYLPPGQDGAKVGLDDFLAGGGTPQQVRDLAETKLRPRQDDSGSTEQRAAHPYEATEHGIAWHKRTGTGSEAIPLTNFTARIVADITEDDGVESRQVFEIETQLRGRTSRFSLPASQFAAMSWPLEQVGAEAIVEPGIMNRDRARVAIQRLSGDVPRRTRYAHTGWAQIDGQWCYLHAGGAIGEHGPVPGVEVILPAGLEPFALPDPTGDVASAVRASIMLLDLGPLEVMAPLLTGIYRAAIVSCPFGEHFGGPTGQFKTALAALGQQHYGAGFNGTRLPASWTSTANALEGLLFAAKDALIVVDDFAPGGTSTDISKAHRDADRVYRAAGNQAGRARMRADTSLRPARFPRGLPLGTGEDVPRGQSLRARLLIVEVEPGAIDPLALSLAQADGDQGLYALAMAGYVKYLARQYETLRNGLQAEVQRLRAEVSGSHRRTPDLIAHLLLGVRHLAAYAREVEAVDDAGARELEARLREGLLTAAALQTRFQGDSEPTRRFLELLDSAISAGRAHLANIHDGLPDDANAWGWNDEGQEWRSRGPRVGWIDGEDLYLEPDASFAAVQSLAGPSGEMIPITAQTLRKRLDERGLLRSRDPSRETLTIRKVIGKSRRRVLHLRLSDLRPPTTRATDPDGQVGQAPETPHPNGALADARATEQTSLPLPTCQYDRHRSSDWVSHDNKRTCGTCHPPAAPELVQRWITDEV